MKTIAQIIHQKTLPLRIRNDQGNQIYREVEGSYWGKSKYDNNGHETHYEDSAGYWAKRTFDDNGNESSYENADGDIRDNR